VVSGQGLREGIALSQFGSCLPSPLEVRRSAVAALAARFSSWNPHLARQRTEALLALQGRLAPELDPVLVETLGHAATLLDIGRSVDFYSRHDHTAAIVLAADLSGFSHRGLALLAATVRFGEKDIAHLKSWAPLLSSADQPSLARVGALLGLADSIARQAPVDTPTPVTFSRADGQLMLSSDWLDPWPLQAAARRVQNVFAVGVVVNAC
jgi:exopolyphosphatase/pppGpp-phosphohydrolase